MNSNTKDDPGDVFSLTAEMSDNFTLTLENACKISELIPENTKGDAAARFSPWLDWDLPFAEVEPENSLEASIGIDTIAELNAAYQILNTHKNAAEPRYDRVIVADLEPNPYWNMTSDKLLMSRVKFWAVVINEAGADRFPDCTMTVRLYSGKYQVINHHYQLAALRLLQIKAVTVSIIYLTDLQMERSLRLERTIN